MGLLAALFLGTFVAEDAACLAAAVLIQQGRVQPGAAIVATALGIYAGDLALWVAGRACGARALRWGVVARRFTPSRRAGFREWFNRRAPVVLLASRVTPGSRLPLYVAAGACGGTFRPFALWSAVAVALWTPAIILAASAGGPAAIAVVILLLARPLAKALTTRGRYELVASIARLWRWEFWPMWLFYAPVAAWTGLLALRHGGYNTITAANPGIEDGGLVGESKWEILRRLPPEWTVPATRIEPGALEQRCVALERHLASTGWAWPLVLKPDVGQRGVGVKLARDLEGARAYFAGQGSAVLVQPYDPGPFEAGVFYYRKPSWARGLIFSVTDKRFPLLVGDGRSSVEELIWKHPRYRMQARVFLTRHAAQRERVLAAGEPLVLANAGNHAQGTMFLRGSHLITPALERRIDEIARAYPGFLVGRFDIRYRDANSFKQGRGFAIVELNGATAESTDIYDPDRSLWSAYSTLFTQWALVFEIGAANRAAGAPVTSTRRLMQLLRTHLAAKPAHAVSD